MVRAYEQLFALGVAHSAELEGRVRGLVGAENVRLL